MFSCKFFLKICCFNTMITLPCFVISPNIIIMTISANDIKRDNAQVHISIKTKYSDAKPKANKKYVLASVRWRGAYWV